jgi:hypothetical protein
MAFFFDGITDNLLSPCEGSFTFFFIHEYDIYLTALFVGHFG